MGADQVQLQSVKEHDSKPWSFPEGVTAASSALSFDKIFGHKDNTKSLSDELAKKNGGIDPALKEALDAIQKSGGAKAIREQLGQQGAKGSDLESKLNIVAAKTLLDAAEASAKGYSNNDRNEKRHAENLLKALKTEDPSAFTEGPHAAELKGALTQAQRREMIDLANGKAAAVGFSQRARESSDDAKAVDNLVMAEMLNKDAARQEQERMAQRGSHAWNNLLADGAGLAATLGTAQLTKSALNAIPQLANVDGRLKFAATAAIALLPGTMANNAVRGESLMDLSGAGRNAFMAGLSYAAMAGLTRLPSEMAAGTLAQAERIAGTAGIGAGFAGSYKAMDIATGNRADGANYRDPNQWAQEVGWAAVKGAAFTLAFSQAIKASGQLAEAALPKNAVGNALQYIGPKEIASAATANAIMMTSPLTDRMGTSYGAASFDLQLNRANKLIESQENVKKTMESQVFLGKK